MVFMFKRRYMDKELMNYSVQQVECCLTCANSDLIDMDMLLCKLCGEEVSSIGVCDYYGPEEQETVG